MLETVYVCDSFDVLVTDLLYTSLYSWSIVHIQKVSSMSEKVTHKMILPPTCLNCRHHKVVPSVAIKIFKYKLTAVKDLQTILSFVKKLDVMEKYSIVER